MIHGLLRSIILASVSLCLSQGRLCKTAERIEVLFGVETPGDPRNIVVDIGGPYSLLRGEGVQVIYTFATHLLN